MVTPSSVDPDKVQQCIKYLKNRPDMKVPEAMKLTNFAAEEVADLSLRCFIQQSLPGKTLKGMKTSRWDLFCRHCCNLILPSDVSIAQSMTKAQSSSRALVRAQ
jgi:hypothetical protein